MIVADVATHDGPCIPSAAAPSIGEIVGPHDIAFVGRGNAVTSLGLGGHPAGRAGLGPLGGAIDSNPYGLLAEPAQLHVTDAGGNSLISVAADRATAVVTTFAPTPAPPPFHPSEAVPTEVVRGPDGAVYVSNKGNRAGVGEVLRFQP